MILVLWLSRLCWRASLALSEWRVSRPLQRAGDALYNRCWRYEVRRIAKRDRRRQIERVIAESRTPSNRVGAPIHRDR